MGELALGQLSVWRAQDCFEGQFWWQLPDDAPAGEYSLELAPIAPVRRTDLWGVLERGIRPRSNRVPLDRIHIVTARPDQLSTPSVPVLPPLGLAIEHPMLAKLANQVRFLGYDLDPTSVQAGQPLTVTLYWQALAPTDTVTAIPTPLPAPVPAVPDMPFRICLPLVEDHP
jgi:hypothetical protein